MIFSKKYFWLLILFFFIAQSCKKEDKNQQPVKTTYCETPADKQWNVPFPKWIFYHWVWEDESTQQSAIALVNDYLANDIPVGAIIIDSPWETDYNTFNWDLNLYPDAQAMIDFFHSKDVRVFIWITNMMNVGVEPYYSEAASNNYFLTRAPGDTIPGVFRWWKGDGSAIDFFNPDAVQWWKGLMDKVLDMNIDGWKVDGADYNTFLANVRYSPYMNDYVQRIDYSHAYYRLFHDYTREKLGNDRVNTVRPIDNYGLDIGGEVASFAPVDINWAGWVGDQDATFSGLRAALSNMYHSAQFGYLAFGSDIGGYREDKTFPNSRSKEVFIRWTQLGAFSPIMENGGGGEHRPWMFDEQTLNIYRNLVKLRHGCLINYLMDEAQKAWNENRSMMTFISKAKYSYLLGSDIFVSPFLEEGVDISVTFPTGHQWIYLYDKSKIYEGGTTVDLTIPYDEFPVFLRGGSSLDDAIDFTNN